MPQFQFKIKLKYITKPPVWRRISVPSDISFNKLADVILDAFGWSGYHLWQFSPTGYGSRPVIAVPNPDDWEKPDKNARRYKLNEFFHEESDKIVFIYDFGDDWTHEVVLEKIVEGVSRKCILIDAKGATPPEDCGGPMGYEHLKKVLGDPKDPEYQDIAEWLGMEQDEYWDPKFPDIEPGTELGNNLVSPDFN